MTEVSTVLAHARANLPQSELRWFDLLRIPSISAQPKHANDCSKAAHWLSGQLEEIGFDAKVHLTAGHPVVLAHHPGPGGDAPHILYYGHYDVQPADPLDLWTSDPFEPAVVDGPHGRRVVARGAVDDKGQTMTWLEALRAWHERAGGPPARVTVLIEGEEEVGSKNLDTFLEENADALRADIVVISDTNMWDIDTPAISTRLRGLLYTQIDITAANRDLHSGMYGGSALNPINLLTRILGDLKAEDGTIRIPGFYDNVQELPQELRRQWATLGFDEKKFLGDIGLSVPSGESGRSALERLWARPTADINGIWGGYTGEGSKTVIAAEAHAKLSFRLVPGQVPSDIIKGLYDFLMDRMPEDARAKIQVFSHGQAIEVPADGPWVRAAQEALSEEFGRPAVLIGCGGSIPVVESFRRVLGMDSLLVGFGLDDDQVHSPNEKFELRCFERGVGSHVRLLAKLAAVKGA